MPLFFQPPPEPPAEQATWQTPAEIAAYEEVSSHQRVVIPERQDLHRMDPGDVELRVGIGTTPRIRGDAGAALWAASWHTEQASLDVGLLRAGPLALSVGIEGEYGRPWIVTTAINGARMTYLPNIPASVSAEHWGVAGRGALHIAPRPDGVLQPYLAASIGMRQLALSVQHEGSAIQAQAGYQLKSAQLTPRVGLDLVLGPGFVLGWEGGYSVGLYNEADSVLALSALGFDIVSNQQSDDQREAPRGWVWSSKIGWRF